MSQALQEQQINKTRMDRVSNEWVLKECGLKGNPIVQSECRVALLTHWISLDPLANLGFQVPTSLAGFYCEQISITSFTEIVLSGSHLYRALFEDEPVLSDTMVVSGGWWQNVSYPYNKDVIPPGKMTAKAVLICRPNSHPFQERALSLEQPIKVGRSVARARASPNNAIFDCKVLSRNHALLWYDTGKGIDHKGEDMGGTDSSKCANGRRRVEESAGGRTDTKSSNGTFVNNQRLSKGAEESPPREVCSGDIVQFGVDVMENARKVTHGCIVANLKLYLPDGKEAKASFTLLGYTSKGHIEEFGVEQSQVDIDEALQREQLLENKLATLQRLVETTRHASDLGWKSLIDEDRLLSRVEVLENQLQIYSKNFAEDKLREELRKLQEDKCQYQGSAKESLRKVLQEKLEAIQKLQDIERTLSNTEDECARLKELCEQSQQDLQDLAHKYCQQLQKVEELTSQLQETEDQHREVCEHLEQEKLELQARIQEQLEAERALQIRLEALQADGDLTQKQLVALQSHLHTLKSNDDDDDDVDTKLDTDNIKSTDSTGTQVDIILERIEPSSEDNLKDVLENTHEEIEVLQHQLNLSEEELKESHARVDELITQLEETRDHEDSSAETIQQLQEGLKSLELDLERGYLDTKITQLYLAPSEAGAPASRPVRTPLQPSLHRMGIPVHNSVSSPNQDNKLKAEITKLKELLSEARNNKRLAEQQVAQFQLELDYEKNKVKKATETSNLLKQQLQCTVQSDMFWVLYVLRSVSYAHNTSRLLLKQCTFGRVRARLSMEFHQAQKVLLLGLIGCQTLIIVLDQGDSPLGAVAYHLHLCSFLLEQLTAENEVQEKSKTAIKLQEHTQRLEILSDGKQQVHHLQESLLAEQQRSSKHSEESEKLRKQLIEAQQCAKQNRNEAEQMKDRMRAVQQELEVKQRILSEVNTNDDNRNHERLEEMKQYCESLQADKENVLSKQFLLQYHQGGCLVITSRLKLMTQHIEEENVVLRKTHSYMETLKSHLGEELNENIFSVLEDQCLQHKETLQMLKSLEEELVILKESFAQCNEERTQLFHDLSNLRQEFCSIVNHSNAVCIYMNRESRTILVIVELLATSSTLEAIKCGELDPVKSSLPTTIFAMYLPQRSGEGKTCLTSFIPPPLVTATPPRGGVGGCRAPPIIKEQGCMNRQRQTVLPGATPISFSKQKS
uniref:FHA domain-containing protein n=1 Tax=Timema monikensis TaxID=170555 RepID=A0A7R9HKJ3_9NEOP|nr:unnamed protein product [Timema monikensis]